ncbi:MAG: glycoside hydrolase family 127 protein [Clostridia bacterium]|nr:glycoside hydrolase family 127 protein [Clostridia bacterium]
MKKILAATAAAVMTVSTLASCTGPQSELLSFEPETNIAGNPLYDDSVKLLQFDYNEVTLLDGMYKEVYDGCMEYYDTLTADDVLYVWRTFAGVDTKTGRDLGWFPAKGNGQCGLGQLVSAKARKYAVTKAPEDLEVVQQIVDGYLELMEVSNPCVGCESWFFDYDRRLRGFLDAYIYCNIEDAYNIAKAIVEYAIAKPFYNEPGKKLGDNSTEWYTLGEALNIFASLAEQKGESAEDIARYHEFANKYEYNEFWDIFLYGKNLFDYHPHSTISHYPGFHAYSHITSIRSAIEFYKKTGNEDYLKSAISFIDWLDETQRLATGGFGIHSEQFYPADMMVSDLDETDKTYETQCNSYALVSINDMLMTYTANADYGNWIEDSFYNMTIASLETENGWAFYCTHIPTTGGTKFLEARWPWSCCAGSRPLIMMEYLRSIYFHDTQNLYVNLYTNSTIDFENANGNKITLTQNSQYPVEDTVNFTVNVANAEEFAISFREPEWIASGAIITVNGEKVAYEEENGWYIVKRTWSDGDTVMIQLPMNLYYDVITPELRSDGLYAMSYGPITLASEGHPIHLEIKVSRYADPNEILERVDGTLNFILKENSSIVFKPYYVYEEGELYTMYMRYVIKN